MNLRALGMPMGKMAVSATVMGAVALNLSHSTGLAQGTGDNVTDLILLAGIATASFAGYFILAAILGCNEALKVMLRRRSGKRK